MGSEEVLADLARESRECSKALATTVAHVEHLRETSEAVWKQLGKLETKLDDTAKDIVTKIEDKVDRGIACAVADRRLCDVRFTALEVQQGVTTTRLATVIACSFFALQLIVWLAQWGFTKVMASATGVGP